MNDCEFKLINIIASYIKQYIKSIILFIIFVLVFCVVFSLYDLELEAIFYSAILCIFIGVISICLNFINYYKKHLKLYNLQKEISLSLENLPTPKNLIENDYTNLILNIDKDYKNYISKLDMAKTDMLDYYTMWVH